MDYLVELHQELIALKIRVLKLELELEDKKNANKVLECMVNGEKELRKMSDEGFQSLVKINDAFQKKIVELEARLKEAKNE